MRDPTTINIETGWLIERTNEGIPHWWTGSSWTTDSLAAIRFARKCDAEAVIRGVLGEFCKATATEHQWI